MDTSMIVVLLVGLIQIILILSVVHISGKVDEICKEMKDMNENLKKIISNTKKTNRIFHPQQKTPRPVGAERG